MNQIAALFACLALCVTALVPSGYMAVQAADGSVTIRICNSQGSGGTAIASDHPLYEALLQSQQQRDGHDDTADDEPCDTGPSSLAHLDTKDADAERMACSLPAQHTATALTGIFPSGLPPSTGPPLS